MGRSFIVMQVSVVPLNESTACMAMCITAARALRQSCNRHVLTTRAHNFITDTRSFLPKAVRLVVGCVLDALLIKNVYWEIVAWLRVAELCLAIQVALHEFGGAVVEARDGRVVCAALVHAHAHLRRQ